MKTATKTCKNINMTFINDYKAYIPLANCSTQHIISTSKLTCLARIYFLFADLFAHLEEQTNGLREVEKSGQQWANLLGCSEEWIFQIQKKLEAAGYFQIIRNKDEDNQNEKNIIIPTLPDGVLEQLDKEPNRIGKEYLMFVANKHEGCKRSYFDSSKMFVQFNLKMIKMLLTDKSLTPLQKLIWIHCHSRSHKAYTDSEGEGTRNFISTYQEIASLFSCSEKTVSTAIRNLTVLGYISKKQFRIQEPGKVGRRKKKSCWEISALFPEDKMEFLLQQPDRQNLSPLTEDDKRLYGFEPEEEQNTDVVCNLYNSSERSGGSSESWQYNNKDHISNINKNTVKDVEYQTNVDNIHNVSFKKDLMASLQEHSQGIQITAKFNKAFAENLETMECPEAIAAADASLTQEEHWVTTKTAYTLEQNLTQKEQQVITNATVVEKSKFNSTADFKERKREEVLNSYSEEERNLIAMWRDLIGTVEKIETQEFLIRKSWLMKLLQQRETEEKRLDFPKSQTVPDLLAQMQHQDAAKLIADKADKAKRFAYAIKAKGLAKGYAAEVSKETLALEFVHHAANWVPVKLNCKSRAEQIDAALSFAWKAAANGTWKCPYQVLNTQIQQREQEAASWLKW